MVLLGDFNAHNPDWNVHYGQKMNVTELEILVMTYNLILNNKPRKATRPTRRKMTSIIYLAFTIPNNSALNM